MKTNSVIYKNPEKEKVFDLTGVGTYTKHGESIISVIQENHMFQKGDAIYYDVNKQEFSKAIAQNTIESEVCGLVTDIKSKDEFTITPKGLIKTDRYDFSPGTILYLSDAVYGNLVSIEPRIIKQVGIQVPGGIMINIQRGFLYPEEETDIELEPYTQQELEEIIKNVWR